MPEISVLLTTHNRADLLPQVLRGIVHQRLHPTRFELIVIDDGSTDETQSVLAAWQKCLPMRIVRQNQAGLAAAKNLGIFLASAPLILFLDDDDVAEPALLTSHLAAHIAYPDDNMAVLGRTTLAPEVAALPLMRYVTEVGCQLFSDHIFRPGQILDYTCFWGGRSSCKRKLLVRHGVFHPAFRFGCEDIELGYRLSSFGLRVVYEPHAHTVMIRALNFRQFCARSYRQGRSQHRFAELHEAPEVQAYCEIAQAAEIWTRDRTQYAGHLRWTEQMDRLAQARAEAGLPVHPVLQANLEAAYNKAFALSRAKGIADAAALAPKTPPQANDNFSGVFTYGLAVPQN